MFFEAQKSYFGNWGYVIFLLFHLLTAGNHAPAPQMNITKSQYEEKRREIWRESGVCMRVCIRVCEREREIVGEQER